jgi:hypothetical protein
MAPVLREPDQRVPARILGFLCAVVLGGTLVAGLWPFHAPRNNVSWLPGNRGLHFGQTGTILSSGLFDPTPGEGQPNRSLEIWITPTIWDKPDTLLAFYAPKDGEHFLLRQAYKDLIFESAVQTPGREIRQAKLHVDGLLHQKRSVFIAVASGPQRTAVWVDGSLAQSAPPFPPAFTGSLVVANSAVRNNSWEGDLLGLAIYDSELSPEQIVRHYKSWTVQGRPRITENDRALALYLFDEGHGSIVHDRSGSGLDLYIPQRYMILHQKLLEPFWKEFSWDQDYWYSAFVNVVGLVPLGFFYCAYLTWVRSMKQAALATVLLGLMVSLTIEILQAFLPTRDSGTTDLITNTLGTYLGTVLYLKTGARDLLARALQGFPLAARR